MASKRKSFAPVKTCDAKRRELSWNMTDLLTPFIDDSQTLELISETTSSTTLTAEPDIDGELCQLIDERDFYVGIKGLAGDCQDRSCQWRGLLGHFELQLLGVPSSLNGFLACLFKHVTEFWLYVDLTNAKHLLYITLPDTVPLVDETTVQTSKQNKAKLKGKSAQSKTRDSVMYFHSRCTLPVNCFNGLQSKKDFCLQLTTFCCESNSLTVGVYLLEAALFAPSFASEAIRTRRCHSTIQQLVEHFFGIESEGYLSQKVTKKHNIDELYIEVKHRHDDQQPQTQEPRVNVQHVCLRPCLREYQKQAVDWMLYKETQAEAADSDTHATTETLHFLYSELKLPDGQLMYYNRHCGLLVKQKPVTARPSGGGGILADEMGLGKTVEILALVLLHRRQDLELVDKLPVFQQNVPNAEPQKHGMKARKRLLKTLTISLQNSEPPAVSEPSTENTSPAVGEESPGTSDSDTKASSSVDAADVKTCDDKNSSTCTLLSLGTVDDHTYSKSDDDDELKSHDTVNAANHCCRFSAVESSSSPVNFDVCSPLSASDTISVDSAIDLELVLETADVKSSVKVEDCSIKVEGTGNCIVTTGMKVEPGACKQCSLSLGNSIKTESESIRLTDVDVDNGTVNESSPIDAGLVAMETSELDGECRESCPVDADGILLECQCGVEVCDSQFVVQCVRCQSHQHARCVNYDLADPYRGRYLCPHCHVVEPPVPSSATLIVAPNSISHQWVDEILRHVAVDALKILVYTGVNKLGYIQPQTLAAQDIVITTYETLRKEIDYVDLPHTSSYCTAGDAVRKFRHPKRFMAIPSPLIAVEWWRICLDEAQMVEATTTKTAEMALRLSTINRWCVTGTPIQRSIDDIYGLLLFLGLEPYWVKLWWNKLLFEPFCAGVKEPLYDVMSRVMWRTSKDDVLDQICLPPQTIEVHWLTFTPVEEHFYRKHYKECATEALQKLRTLTDSHMKLNSLDKFTLHQLLTPLVRLRQACCHPQVVRGHYLPIQKRTMTMEDLLTHLINKTRFECEEAHRRMVFASTGLAGLHIINSEYVLAAEEYRSMLRSIDEHCGEVRTDALQILHIVHNLHDVLQLKPAGVGHTLIDSQLVDQEKEIQDKYLTKSATFVTTAKESWTIHRKTVVDLQNQMCEDSEWWADLLQWVMYVHLDDKLVEDVKNGLLENVDKEQPNMAYKFRDVRGLQYLLSEQVDQLDTCRQRVIEHLERISHLDPRHVVDDVVECCLRPPTTATSRRPDSQLCTFCVADKELKNYEGKLFFCVEKGLFDADEADDVQVGTKRQVTWADSDTEKTFKALINFAKTFAGNKHDIESGLLNLKLLDSLKKEFRCLRPVWMSLRERICAIDEMRMAVSRMRLRQPNEPITDPPQANIIESSELETRRLKFVSDKICARSELRAKKGQLRYLKNLSKPQSSDSTDNPDPCPICHQILGNKWSVLQCGHCYCLPCIQEIIDKYSYVAVGPGSVAPYPVATGTPRRQRRIACALCRQSTVHSDISYVSLRDKTQDDDDECNDITVKGDHSTKIEGVIRCLLHIQRTDKEAKSLVFSTWSEVLDILADALKDNDIKFRQLQAANKFEESLYSFKSEPDVRVLLLPIHSGSNGLNLIEATHVLLVEPVLNTAQELQAIGRVHRIGQTRPTVVHRFLVRGTIEVKMHDLLQAVNAPLECHDAEQSTLTIGDLNKLFELTDDANSGQVAADTSTSP